MHRHKCWNCGLIWQHSDVCFGSEFAHTCMHCGELQWSKYFGDDNAAPTIWPTDNCAAFGAYNA